MGRALKFGPHFSFPPSHLFNCLARLLSSSSGGELHCTGSGEPILSPCLCVRLRVCVCARGRRERERDSVSGRDEREAPSSCASQLSRRILVQSCPAASPTQTRALRHDWLIFTSIHNDQARTRLLNITRPSCLSSLSLSSSTSP